MPPLKELPYHPVHTEDWVKSYGRLCKGGKPQPPGSRGIELIIIAATAFPLYGPHHYSRVGQLCDATGVVSAREQSQLTRTEAAIDHSRAFTGMSTTSCEASLSSRACPCRCAPLLSLSLSLSLSASPSGLSGSNTSRDTIVRQPSGLLQQSVLQSCYGPFPRIFQP